MEECSFLSSYESDIECFKECALYNYKGTGGVCPFKNLTEYTISKLNSRVSLMETIERDLGFIKESYLERKSQYL
jgi:hypothetical protein